MERDTGAKTQIFITKLPMNVTKMEVEDLFDRYGNILNIDIKKAFAFVVRLLRDLFALS